MTIAGSTRNKYDPGATMEPGRPNRSATQPPNLHHSHAGRVDDSTPRQNEIAIRNMRDSLLPQLQRAGTHATPASRSPALDWR